jgi:hypothetical protein
VSSAGFLLVAIGLSVVGSMLIWIVNRKPKTFMSSIDDFSREMKALGRDPEAVQGGRRRKRTAEPPGRKLGPSSRPAINGPAGPVAKPDGPDPTQERRS